MFEITTQMIQAFAILVSVAAFGLAAWMYVWVKAQPSSNKRIAEIGQYIKEGANTFLKRE